MANKTQNVAEGSGVLEVAADPIPPPPPPAVNPPPEPIEVQPLANLPASDDIPGHPLENGAEENHPVVEAIEAAEAIEPVEAVEMIEVAQVLEAVEAIGIVEIEAVEQPIVPLHGNTPLRKSLYGLLLD